jgi:arsenite transporter
MSVFERYLTLWVALCIVAGIALGHLFPRGFQAVGALEVAKVNLPVAALIWLMVIPMLIKIDFASLGRVREHWRGIGVTLFINWASNRSRWQRSAGCSSATCSSPTCPPTRSTPTSPA